MRIALCLTGLLGGLNGKVVKEKLLILGMDYFGIKKMLLKEIMLMCFFILGMMEGMI